MKSTRASEMAYSRKLIEVDWQMQRSHCPVGCRTHPQGRSGNYQVQCLSRQGGLFGEDFVFHCHPRRMRPRNESLLFRLFPPVWYIHKRTPLYDVSITQACQSLDFVCHNISLRQYQNEKLGKARCALTSSSRSFCGA